MTWMWENAADAAASPTWTHLAVMVLAVLVLAYNLAKSGR